MVEYLIICGKGSNHAIYHFKSYMYIADHRIGVRFLLLGRYVPFHTLPIGAGNQRAFHAQLFGDHTR